MNWRWALVTIVVALSLARWVIESNRLGEAARAPASVPAAMPAATPSYQRSDLPQADRRLPEHYPTDVPLFPNAQIVETAVLPRSERLAWNIVFHAEAEPGELESWYKPALESRGWQVTRLESLPAASNDAELGRILVATKHGRRLEILWGESKADWNRTVSQLLLEPTKRSLQE